MSPCAGTALQLRGSSAAREATKKLEVYVDDTLVLCEPGTTLLQVRLRHPPFSTQGVGQLSPLHHMGGLDSGLTLPLSRLLLLPSLSTPLPFPSPSPSPPPPPL